MTHEQKEAFRREVLEEAAKVADEREAMRVRLYDENGRVSNAYRASEASAIADDIRALAASQPAPAAERPEDTAERFIQAAIDSAPEPLRRLGEWLANKLDDDDWKTADRLITGAAVSLNRQTAPTADTGQAVDEIDITGWGAWKGHAIPMHVARHIATKVNARMMQPAPLDAERVREAWAYRVHDCHIARSPVKARAKFPEATEHLYPASRHADAIEMARLLGGTCTPLYPPEDAR